jgi:hypothetical protein
MSCATHRLDGGINVELKIFDFQGNCVETMRK